MHTSGSLYGFLVIGGMLAVTPGPNMVYVMSRSIAQGRAAGLISLAGVMIGYLFYMFGAAFGITTLFMSVPYAGTVLGVVGAAYLLYLAWQAVRPAAVRRSRCGPCRTSSRCGCSRWARPPAC